MIKIDHVFGDKAAGIKCNVKLPEMGFDVISDANRMLYRQIGIQTVRLYRELFDEVQTRTYRSQTRVLWARDLMINIDNNIQ